jgi:hypothetical protein
MQLQHQATLVFRNAVDTDEVVATVRYGEGIVALGLSLRSNGDVEGAFNKADLRKLIDALLEAERKA